MRTVIETDPGVVELSWLWLPSWIGMNASLKQEIEKEVAAIAVGQPMTDRFLDDLNDYVINLLVCKYPIHGLRDYLDGLKFVQL